MMKLYFRYLKTGIKEEKLFGINFLFSFFILPIQAFITYYLWKSGMEGEEIKSFTTNSMVLYFFVQNILMISYEPAMYTAYQTCNDISSGRIIIYLIKPVSYPLMMFSKKFGYFVLRLAIGYLTIGVFMVILGEKISIENFMFSVMFSIISFILLYQIQMIIGLLAFRFKNIILLRDLIMDILWILGGVIIPIDFFPNFLHNILSKTVIPLVYYMPSKLLVSDFNSNSILIIFLSGILRVIIYSLIIKLIWTKDSTKANQGA